MDTLKSFASLLSRFLKKVRTILLDLGTALVLLFVVIAIFGALTSSEPDDKDFSGRILLINPQGTVVDQEVFNSDYLSALGSDASDNQIQTRDLCYDNRA